MTQPLPPTDPAVSNTEKLPRRLISRRAVIITAIGGVLIAYSLVLSACGCGSIPDMTMDLYNLVTAEKSYFTDHGSYTSSTTALHFEPSIGVSISITSANATGWAATASRAYTDATCGIFVGSATAPIAGQKAGEPVCVAPGDSSAHPPSHR